jgi:hypothetical protein
MVANKKKLTLYQIIKKKNIDLGNDCREKKSLIRVHNIKLHTQ